ncbi:helix-turn-helix transcriptional regulator, partial [Micromonospora parastrephiae]|uniref:helix-turn-helix transcriptional regulator n=1 Tax=Micromonospora parastrephiae TaxID=2806101 RepID=UPI001EE491C9
PGHPSPTRSPPGGCCACGTPTAPARTRLRDVEPLGYLGNSRHWYLVAWCRLRDELRCFRTDRIRDVRALPEVVSRDFRPADLDIPQRRVRPLSLV